MTSDITKRQRTVPSVKAFEFNWHKPIHPSLLKGVYFDRFDDDSSVEYDCLVRVDEYGFFIYWKSESQEAQVLELSQVSDIRYGSRPKDDKLVAALTEKRGLPLDDRIIQLCSGVDFVNINTANIIAPDCQTAKKWIKLLRKLTHNIKANNVCPMTQLRKHWMRLCLSVNADGKISVRLISKTFASGRSGQKDLEKALKDLGLPYGKNDDVEVSQFSFDVFYDLYRTICHRTDIEDLYSLLVDGDEEMLSSGLLLRFLNGDQRDQTLNELLFPFANHTTISHILSNYEPDTNIALSGNISMECFFRYLMSDDNAPVFLDRLDIHYDMDQPLSHYYINSSHNTYLTGRQLGGKSCVEMYRQVLLAGCRCIELDCWDGKGDDQEPIITHGKAMCTDILFKDVIYAIRDTAFVASEYPVILSFENHCSKPQQFKLAKYCEDILGDLLLTKPIDRHPLHPGVPLPSPEKLRRKILIKNKRLKPDVEKQQLEMFFKGQVEYSQEIGEDANQVDGEDGPLAELNRAIPGDTDAHPEVLLNGENPSSNGENPPSSPPTFNFPPTTSTSTSKPSSSSISSHGGGDLSASAMAKKLEGLSEEEERAVLANYRYTGATTNIHPYLSSLVNYAQPVKFQGFDVAQDQDEHFHMSSFSEAGALVLLKNSAIELVKSRGIHYHMSSCNESYAYGLIKKASIDFVDYNKRQMSRIYPRGNRVDSSNFMPQVFWNAGCQMVALNFQTPDISMQLNQGKFEYNGNCGYLLKPEFMRRRERCFDPFYETPMDGVIAATCKVKVISGQFLSEKKIGTYVEVDMYGLPTDTIRREFRTRVVPGNALNPVYCAVNGDEEFVFRKVVLPELAVLRLGVYEETGKLIGQRVLPLDGLQSGYRHISLRTEGNFPLSLPTLFCKINLTTYVPDGLHEIVDRLVDPQSFREEQRIKQLHRMGIESQEIENVPSPGGRSVYGSSRNTLGPAASRSSVGVPSLLGPPPYRNQAEDETLFESISRERLFRHKAVTQEEERHAKEKRKLAKRQGKEKEVVQKSQAAATAALIHDHKARQAAERKRRGENGQISVMEEKLQAELRALNAAQTEEWTKLLARLSEEEFNHSQDLLERKKKAMIKALHDLQQVQTKELQAMNVREAKQLQIVQSTKSIESKGNIKNDKNLKAAERERRIKEIEQNNTKMFFQQRTSQGKVHERRHKKLKARQEQDEEELIRSFEESKQELVQVFREKRLSLSTPVTVL